MSHITAPHITALHHPQSSELNTPSTGTSPQPNRLQDISAIAPDHGGRVDLTRSLRAAPEQPRHQEAKPNRAQQTAHQRALTIMTSVIDDLSESWPAAMGNTCTAPASTTNSKDVHTQLHAWVIKLQHLAFLSAQSWDAVKDGLQQALLKQIPAANPSLSTAVNTVFAEAATHYRILRSPGGALIGAHFKANKAHFSFDKEFVFSAEDKQLRNKRQRVAETSQALTSAGDAFEVWTSLTEAQKHMADKQFNCSTMPYNATLGAGGQATVKLARLFRLPEGQQLVALKKFHGQGAWHNATIEYEYYQLLGHNPHSLQCYGISYVQTPTVSGDLTNKAYLLLTAANAGTLFDFVLNGDEWQHLRAQQPDHFDRRCLQFIDDLLQGLVYFHHTVKLFHGDLKLENILLQRNQEGQLKCLYSDFGLATTNEKPWPKTGTAGYIAPEQWQESRHHENLSAEKQDIYAFAVMCYRLITGHRPTVNPVTALQATRSCIATACGVYAQTLRPIQYALFQLIDAMSADDPKQRPKAQEALARIRELIQNEATQEMTKAPSAS